MQCFQVVLFEIQQGKNYVSGALHFAFNFTYTLSGLASVLLAMGSGRENVYDKIAAIVALFKAGHSVKEISENTGVAVRSVQRWLKGFKDGGGHYYLPHISAVADPGNSRNTL